MDRRVLLNDIDWAEVAEQLASRGWARLQRAVAPDGLEALARAAPGPWSTLPETEGSAGVRQAGAACHSSVDAAPAAVRSLAEEIRVGIDRAVAHGVGPLPVFNHAEWCRAEGGQKYITPHRDPDTAGGAIAVLTIHGRAVFRVWEMDGSIADAQSHPELAATWETEGGDLVVMRGRGWPLPTSMCPLHEAESPPEGDRVTLTLRHNIRGYGSDYFG